MNLVLIHIGNTLPDYIGDTIEQVRKFYDGNLILVKSKHCDMTHLDDMTVIDYESLLDHHRVQEFKNVSTLQGFWGVTCERFIILESLMEKIKLDTVFHIENDVTIYNDLTNLLPLVKKHCKDSVVINPTGPEISTGAFIYVDNLKAISFMNEQFINFLRNPNLVTDRLNEKFMSEMKFLNILNLDYPDKVQAFPILPHQEGLGESTDLLFDCATWGQLLGGTPGGMLGAERFPHHWIGQEMYPERKYEYEWIEDDKGRRCIFVVDKSGNKYKLNNLHIHCKRVKEFMS